MPASGEIKAQGSSKVPDRYDVCAVNEVVFAKTPHTQDNLAR